MNVHAKRLFREAGAVLAKLLGERAPLARVHVRTELAQQQVDFAQREVAVAVDVECVENLDEQPVLLDLRLAAQRRRPSLRENAQSPSTQTHR